MHPPESLVPVDEDTTDYEPILEAALKNASHCRLDCGLAAVFEALLVEVKHHRVLGSRWSPLTDLDHALVAFAQKEAE